MNSNIRRKLDMATRVRDFSRDHPSPDQSYATMLGRLEERLTRAETLATQQRAGVIAVRTSTVGRQELRRALHESLLRHLVLLAQAASRELPDLGERFRLPPLKLNERNFLTVARAMAATARAERALLEQHGMATTLVTDLDQALKEYDGLVEEAHAGRLDHVGAGADLQEVTRELMRLVKLLDGLNRYRFRNDAEQRAAWESAKNVFGPEHPKPDASEGGTAPAEVIKPAA